MIEGVAEVDAAFPWFFPLMAGIFGACIGSFLNVVIYRLPAGRSLVTPGSQCACGTPLRWYDNVPVLGWLHRRGRARCCGARISARYPFVEALTAFLFAVAWLQYEPLVALVVMFFVAWMIAPSFIDLDTMEIPDVFSIGGFLLGVLFSALVPALHGWEGDLWLVDAMRGGFSAIVGGFIASGLILWVALVAETVLRKEAMGFGDVKLMGAIGAFCGWQGGIFALFAGAILGCLGFLFAAVLGRFSGEVAAETSKPMDDGEEQDEGARIPFGPALAAAAVLYLLWLQPYVDAYFENFISLLYRTL